MAGQTNSTDQKTNDFLKGFANAENLMDMYKKNLEIMSLVNQMSLEVYKSVAKLQTTFMQQMFTDACNACKTTKPSEAMEKFSELAKNNMATAIENSKKISELVSTAGNDVANLVTKRFKESIDEVKNACNKG